MDNDGTEGVGEDIGATSEFTDDSPPSRKPSKTQTESVLPLSFVSAGILNLVLGLGLGSP